MPKIKPDQLLKTHERRSVLAALAMQGLDQRTYAAQQDLSYQRLNRMLNGKEVVTKSYARRLNNLVRTHLIGAVQEVTTIDHLAA